MAVNSVVPSNRHVYFISLASPCCSQAFYSCTKSQILELGDSVICFTIFGVHGTIQ